MFGDRYFSARKHLADLMRQIAALGAESKIDLSARLPMAELESGTLGPPFRLLACGETNSGKSAFLNALMGHPICPMSRLPETNRVTTYRYGQPASDAEDGPFLRSSLRPLPLLRDFQLIDTPGLHAVPDAADRAAEELMATVDAVFVVLPYTNPWGAPAWNLISRLPSQILDRIVIIIQQVDRASPADLPVIRGHLRELSIKKIGRELPVFPVSATLAFEARQASPENADLLAASGFADLEQHLSAMVCSTPERVALMASWRDQSAAALHTVENRFDRYDQTQREHGSFLQRVECDILQLREHFLKQLPEHLKSVAEVFQREAVAATRFLRRQMGTLRSIIWAFVGHRNIHAVETVFVERLDAAVKSVAEKDGDEVVAVCRKHRELLTKQVKEATGVDLGDHATADAQLSAARAWFVERVSHAAREGIGELQVRSLLAKDLVRRNRAIKSFLFVSLPLAAAAGVCGALRQHPWLAYGLLGASLVFLLGAAVVAWLAMRKVAGAFQDRLLDTCTSFATALKADYEAALRAVFQQHLETLAPLRQHLAETKSALEPAKKRRTDLFLSLKSIEQDHLV